MSRLKRVLKTDVGIATGITFVIAVLYIVWLFAFSRNDEIERRVSAFCLTLPYIMFIVFGFRMIRQYPMEPKLRRSWTLLVLSHVSIVIAEVIFVLQGRPALSLADFFFVGYFLLYIPGILLFPFVPVSRRERALMLLDLSVVMLACLLLLWYFLIDTVVQWRMSNNFAALVNMMYPVLDLIVLAGAVTMIQREVKGIHPVTLLWIAIAGGLAAIADVLLITSSLSALAGELKVSSALFIVLRSFVLLAIAYQVTFLRDPGPVATSSRVKRILGLALPYGACAVFLALLVAVLGSSGTLELRVQGLLFGTVAVVLVVLYRQYIMLGENVYLYEKAEQARGEAVKATRVKAEFLANMSHEIRTPMHGVVGLTELLLNSSLTEAQKNIAETLRNSGNALLTIINEILDFSKIESGKMELESRPFDFRKCVDEASATVHPEAARKRIGLSCSIAPSAPLVIVGDETRLREILLNLLSNAVKFTDRGEVVLTATSRLLQNDDYEFQVDVRDTGIGIPEHLQPELFQSFSQLDSSPTRRHKGTGLGLAISKKLCEMMGGVMWVESREGEGSTFHFTFHARTEAARAATSSPRQELIPIDHHLATRLPLQVLVVEDNPVHQKVAVLMLAEMGYQADIAANGLEALQSYQDRKHDLILMDMQMPEMGGLESARQIRSMQGQGHRPFIVAMTASAMKGDREKCLAAGMDDFLDKPAHLYELQATILRLWNLPASTGAEPAASAPSSAGDELQIPLLNQLPPDRRAAALRELVDAYLADCPERLKELRHALSNRDVASLRFAAHALKGASVILGIHDLADVCLQLEQTGGDGDFAQSKILVQKIERDFEVISRKLSGLLVNVSR